MVSIWHMASMLNWHKMLIL